MKSKLKSKRATTKQYNKVIPILIHNELTNCNYKRKDDLAIIIDSIYRSQIYFKNDLQKKWGFAPVPQSVFAKYIGNKSNIKPAIDYAIESGWIKRYGDTEKCDGFYKIGTQAKTYKITSEYLGTTKNWLITDKTINKKVQKIINAYRKLPLKYLSYSKSNYFKTFSIDKNQAFKAIEDKAIEAIRTAIKPNESITHQECLTLIRCTKDNTYLKYRLSNETNKSINNILHCVIMQQLQVQSINEGYLFYKRNKTNGRLDSNLTSLPGFLKVFIINDRGEDLVNIDIKNSQPFFFYTLLKNDNTIHPIELEKYKSLVLSGNLYEYLIEEYSKITTTPSFRSKTQEEKRDYMKSILFKIFYSQVSSYQPYKTFFFSMFPTIMVFINEKNRLKHNTMAIELQTMESFTIIDKLLIKLQDKKITPLTIHDSFLCAESEVDTIMHEINEVFTHLYDCVPSFHVDVICKPDQYEVEIENKDKYENLSFVEFLELINDDVEPLTTEYLKDSNIYTSTNKPKEDKITTIAEPLSIEYLNELSPNMT